MFFLRKHWPDNKQKAKAFVANTSAIERDVVLKVQRRGVRGDITVNGASTTSTNHFCECSHKCLNAQHPIVCDCAKRGAEGATFRRKGTINMCLISCDCAAIVAIGLGVIKHAF